MQKYFTKEIALNEEQAIASIHQFAHSLHEKKDLEPLFKKIDDARIVLLGEASHGTHEYYSWRSHITRRLIEEKGFNCIAVEGDWPDCYRINRYVKNYFNSGENAHQVLNEFRRWPTWMWANWEMVAFTEWLYQHNHLQPSSKKVGFYGLDVYSLWESMEAIIQYLQKVDQKALEAAEEAFRCFEPYRFDEGRSYARASQLVPDLCTTEVVNMLKNIQKGFKDYDSDYEVAFSTYQNALVAVNAERYYRAMIQGGPHSWNLRDRHMADTLNRLLEFHGQDARIVVWEHNSHIGDARATDMTNEGLYNLGELVRMQHNEKGVVTVGFGSNEGTVTAARKWGGDMKRMKMPTAKKGSWEYLLNHAGDDNKLLIMEDFMDDNFMENHIPQRAIGVVYHPEVEQFGNYVPSLLPLRYDAFIYLDKTSALHPLHLEPDGSQVPETYPFGL